MAVASFDKITFVNFGLHHKYGSYRFLFVWNAIDHCYPESFNSRSSEDRNQILAINNPDDVAAWHDHGKCNNDCAHCPKNHFTQIGSWREKVVPCHQWEKVGWFINDPYSC